MNLPENKTIESKKESIFPHRHTLVLTLVAAIFVFSFSALQMTNAQGGQTTSNSIAYPFMDTSTDINYACEPDMKVFADQQLKDFRTFLEVNFQNKSSTASLLELGIGKYREMREELLTAYSKYYPNEGSFQITTGLQPIACLRIVQETLDDAQILLKRHALQTSGVKKSTALLEKYKALNTQLQDLSQQFVNLKANLDAFSQKLPCYLPKGTCTK